MQPAECRDEGSEGGVFLDANGARALKERIASEQRRRQAEEELKGMIAPLPVEVESAVVSSDELDADSPDPGRSRLGVVYDLLRGRVDAQPQADTG